jgi:excisionase family DNA binding protein
VKIAPNQLLTSAEVGDLLQVNRSSVKNWVDEGRLAAFRTPGGHRRIRAADLVAFLEIHRMPVPQPLATEAPQRLLIVDDDEALLHAYQRTLCRSSDLLVEVVSNGIDALVRVGSFKPNYVLLDFYMPEIDGIEVCRRLKANPETSQVEIFVATAHLTATIEKQALDAGVRECWQKPVDVQVLLSRFVSAPRHRI